MEVPRLNVFVVDLIEWENIADPFACRAIEHLVSCTEHGCTGREIATAADQQQGVGLDDGLKRGRLRQTLRLRRRESHRNGQQRGSGCRNNLAFGLQGASVKGFGQWQSAANVGFGD